MFFGKIIFCCVFCLILQFLTNKFETPFISQSVATLCEPNDLKPFNRIEKALYKLGNKSGFEVYRCCNKEKSFCDTTISKNPYPFKISSRLRQSLIKKVN